MLPTLRNRHWSVVLWLFASSLVLFPQSRWHCAHAVEIKWIPADDNDNSNVPDYSMEERQMLLQLDQQIAQSADPQAMLEQVAKSGGVADPAELQQILMENREFLQQHGGAGAGAGMTGRQQPRQPLAITVVKTIASSLAMLSQLSLKRPRISATLFAAILLYAWIACNAPRNGALLPLHDGVRMTTLFVPPSEFLEATMLDPEWWDARAGVSFRDALDDAGADGSAGKVWKQLETKLQPRKKPKKKKKSSEQDLDDDQVQWHSDFSKTKQTVLKAAVLEKEVSFDDLIAKGADNDSDEEEQEDRKAAMQLFDELLHDQAERLLVRQPQFTEFVPHHKIRVFLPEQEEQSDDSSSPQFAVLMVPGLGRWGAIGYIPLILQPSTAEENSPPKKSDPKQKVLASITLSPFSGTRWEGQQVRVRIVQRQSDSSKVAIQVASTTTTSSSKPLPKKLVNRIVESLGTSLQTSLDTRTRQAWVRRAQSAKYASRARLSAQERRRMRAKLERELEAMAADRRRRRFSENPNQGRYRPSGERMRSPNNAIYK